MVYLHTFKGFLKRCHEILELIYCLKSKVTKKSNLVHKHICNQVSFNFYQIHLSLTEDSNAMK